MKIDKGMLGMLAGVSLFVGFVIIAVGLGAIFPSMHRLSAPLICRGEVKVESIRYSYKPGQVGWEHHIYCVNEQTGEEREITFPAIGMTGLIASAILFVFFAFRMRKSLVLPENFGELATDLKPQTANKSSGRKKKGGSPLERMAELKKMRDANLISEAEYERKKAEIMDEV
ncbi:MAG: SHOCT domain-containing protein [Chloroflexota bacterium]